MAREIIDATAALECLIWNSEDFGSPRELGDVEWVASIRQKIQNARGDARLQLYEGPSARESCDLSFGHATELLREWWRDNGVDLWVHEDDDTEVCYGEPQNDHCCDDECRSTGCWNNEETGYHCVDAAVVGRAIFGDELFEYVR